MNNDLEKTERIVAYLDGTLPDAEVRQLMTERASDPALDAAIREFEVLRNGIEAAARDELREKIAAWEREAAGKNTSRSLPWLWAAGFLLLLSLGTALYFSFNTSEPNAQLMAQQLFEPYPSIVGERNNREPTALDSLMGYYKARKFLEVVEQFRDTPDLPEDERDLWDFYLAESFMAEGKYAKAAAILSTYTERDHALFEIARFHHALALLLNGDLSEAHNGLMMIYAEKGAYRNQAEKLIKKLEHDVFGEGWQE